MSIPSLTPEATLALLRRTRPAAVLIEHPWGGWFVTRGREAARAVPDEVAASLVAAGRVEMLPGESVMGEKYWRAAG